jgi:hypothetical protein
MADDAPSERSPGTGADRFQYELTIRVGPDRRSFVRREPELTAAEMKLIRWVLGGAKPEDS